MFKKIKFFDKGSLRSKLIISYIILIALPICIIGERLYSVSINVIEDIIRKNIYEIVKKDNQIIDTKLLRIQENIISLTADKELYNVFSDISPDSEDNLLLMDEKITRILNKYFAYSEDIYSVQLATSYFNFSSNSMPTKLEHYKNFIPTGGLEKTKIYQAAGKDLGKIKWIPTYEFADMFDVPYMKNINVEYRYLFSVVKSFKDTYYNGTNYLRFEDDVEKPILIINFKEDFFQGIYKNSIPADGSSFYILSKEGSVISSHDQKNLGGNVDFPWFSDIAKKESGTDIVNIDGQKMIICYDTSKVTGWISIVCIPPSQMLAQILPEIRVYTIYFPLILSLAAIMIGFFLSNMITQPINKLIRAIKKTGEGKFDVKIQEEGSKEFKELIIKFNRMNERIKKLIQENYEIKIKEDEAIIMALNLQLDPHFMYNTLNLINLLAVERDENEISEMITSLSSILEYTAKNNKKLVCFSDDMNYLQNYVFIMEKRFEGIFTVEYDIDEKLYKCLVPKFFMQPFVENSLVHGFNGLGHQGNLKICCWTTEECGYFCIEDNGLGICDEKLSDIKNEQIKSIGINNVNKRIKTIFGEQYGIEIVSELGNGTKVTIKLPISE
jgi:two-component system sensor histidine kinase YesM